MIPVRARQACIAVLCFALSVPLLAKDQIGKPGGGGSSISWSLQISGHEMIELTVVTPEGDAYRQEFKAGKDPVFTLSQLESVADGSYSYELRVVPKVSADVKRKLVEAREKNDEKAAKKIRKDAGLLQTIVQSGAFSVVNGSIVSPNQVEGGGSASFGVETTGSASQPGGGRRSFQPVVNDQVIPDDLIVQGSGCFGFDCVNNESFGFDTIRLKENNLRIKAEDTSVGTYPTNDWQLTFNDSTSGGASKFSVEDITGSKVPLTVTAGAPTNSLFIDSMGRVGFRTSTPVLDLSVNTNNTPALRLEQNNSGGFTAQTWDVAGNEANFFVRDLTSGSRLPFRIRPGAPTSSIDIDAEGDVGIGTGSPAAKLDVFGSTTSGLRLRSTASTVGIADMFVEANGNLVMSMTPGTGAHGFLDVRTESSAYGLVLRESTGVALAPYANFYVTDATDDYLSVNLSAGKRGDLTVTASGNVGVNTTSPSSKLHVNGGDIRVTGGSFIDDGTTLNVPDYVFDESYRLMPLPQLAAFIRDQKHLPNVPSAASVKEKGLNMSQMQMRLLEKVEELTLYTLEQHETIGQLNAQNDELRARLEKIERMLAESNQ